MIRYSVYLFTLFCQLSYAQDADVSIFGLHIKKPLEITNCGLIDEKIVPPTDAPCISRSDLTRPWGPTMHSVIFPAEKLPGYVRSIGQEHLAIEVFDNKIERIGFATYGSEVQSHVMSDLNKKLGKPLSFHKVPVQNGMGAKFISLESKWKKNGVKIEFTGIESELEFGHVEIVTDTYDKRYKNWQKNNTVEKQPL